MTWREQVVRTIPELVNELSNSTQEPRALLWRGQASPWPDLSPSLVMRLRTTDYAKGLLCEAELVDKFCIAATDFLNTNEQQCLKRGHSRKEMLAAIGVLQHFGAPTRLLDWTASPWVAAYFACIHSQNEDGVIWMFDSEVLTRSANDRWSSLGIARLEDGSVDLNAAAFRDPPLDWIVRLDYPLPFPRIEAQQGCFTLTGAWNAKHDEAISRLVPTEHRRKVVVPANLKREFLKTLRRMNVHAASIDYPGADHVGLAMRTARLEAESS